MTYTSQTSLLKQHLEAGKTITSLEALRLYGCLRLSARMHDLRSTGLGVEARTITTLSGKRVAEYYIRKETK